MDYSEQLFALQIYLEAHKQVMADLKYGEMTNEELQDRMLMHTKVLLDGAESTAMLIRALRAG